MIYFDNSATTKPCDAAVSAAFNCAVLNFANPSSSHSEGLKAKSVLNNARILVASPRFSHSHAQCVFTSGGTESNNTAIFSGARIKVGKRVITTAIEHPSVLQAMKVLEQNGFDVVYIPVDSGGTINIDMLENACNNDTSLVSVMHVNNETGTILPVEHIAEIVKKRSPRAFFHIDAVQSFGRLPLCEADLISVSSHKLHGLKGTGALLIKKGVFLKPLLYGGGQENGKRGGTQNLPGIMAFAAALEEIDFKADLNHLTIIRNRFLQAIEKIPNIEINSMKNCVSYIVNLSVIGVRAEVLLNALSAHGVMASAGAACSGNKVSHVLSAMGVKYAESALRFSFSRYNTEQQADEAGEILTECVKNLRRGRGL